MEILDDKSVIYQLEVYKKWYEEQQEEIEQLNNIIDEIKELCERQFLDYQVDISGNKRKRYAGIDTNKIMKIIERR